MRRYSVNKRKSSNSFKRQISKTKYPNIGRGPMRGGIRF
ncbi:MAG: hypothetical protein [Microvirus sp.]|nr:MAG: hypothetical protein [Microvirus sp.]